MITHARFTHYGRMKLMMDQYVASPPRPTETEIEQTYERAGTDHLQQNVTAKNLSIKNTEEHGNETETF